MAALRVPVSASLHDRRTARLAELDTIRDVLARAADTVRDGWVQDDWSARGGVCLVTSIRAHSTGQVRARCLDLLWHARHDDAPGARHGVGRVPPPAVRLSRVRDLTRWNDRPDRRVTDVLDLLRAADGLAAAEMVRLRAELWSRIPERSQAACSTVRA